MSPTGGSLADLRRRNLATLLSVIARRGPISRAELTQQLGLGSATVTGLTRELLRESLLAVAETSPDGPGRPREMLTVAREVCAWGLTVRTQAGLVAAARVNYQGEVLESREIPFDAGSAKAIDELARIVEDLTSPAALAGHPGRLIGVGVAVGGPVRTADGRVTSPTLPRLANKPLAHLLSAHSPVPVTVENDVNALALAQYLYGPARELRSFLTVTIGHGVGMAVVLREQLYHGLGDAAGEIDHVQVDPDGRPCSCGSTGCLHAYTSTHAMLSAAAESGVLTRTGSDDSDLDQLASLARDGDRRAASVFAAAGRRLGQVLSPVAAALAPEALIVSGEGVRHWDLLGDGFEQSLRAARLSAAVTLPVVVGEWDHLAWLRGAAACALHLPMSDNAPTS
ncbi:ROK family protein [Streptomyces formicae]|uniref:ROK family protein n=1 Tax=Streptomyces formicae TaxID=1616117 RepID=A0ABY3WS61_9ACTN|nr:ROK family protein [Streptomyces formicae]UNM12623.1 ROK family protein [Streptomyces formicae]